MNTDAILDFVVDNYIWFIIGGVVLLLAILGLIADKRKIIPKNKKTISDDNNLKKDIKADETIDIKSEPEKVPEVMDNLINNEPELETLEPVDMDSLVDSNGNETIDAEENTENNMDIFNVQPDLTKDSDNLDFNEEQKNLENEDNDAANVITSIPQVEEVSEEDINQKTNDIDSLSVTDENNDSKVSSFAYSTVDDDIDKINNLKFSDDSSSLNLKNNDKLEDTMQISYSQLKEMVQDIIAENEAESNEGKLMDENNDEEKLNSVQKDDEQAAVSENDTISNEMVQQDDEDDVWKF